MFSTLSSYSKQLFQLGPRTVAQACARRFKGALIERYWRYKLFRNYAHCLKGCKTTRSVAFVRSLYADIPDTQIIAQADEYTKNCFSIRGCGKQYFITMPWHADFRLHAQHAYVDYQFDKKAFYKDIRIKPGKGAALIKDIKVPWELSRFQHGFILGKAYEITGAQQYAETFVRQITDWLDNNSFMRGPNWLCPMEVGLRAINWIVAYDFFKDSYFLPDYFKKRFISSLYDHKVYLEYNWELESRTSNNYLSDLIAYFYLCHFFDDHERAQWCYQQVLSECEKQVFPEGSDYEGSTRHHRYVTELFYHFYLLCTENGITLPELFCKKLQAMINYTQWTTDHGGYQVVIGDDDGRSVLIFGLPLSSIEKIKSTLTDYETPQVEVAHFNQVGVSIIKTLARGTAQWHVTMRHHAYNYKQPSSHLHNDFGSITLSVDGIPVIVDPGSFVYTPSSVWRNQFRSVAVHNMFFVTGIEPVELNDRLFDFDLPPATIAYTYDDLVLRTEHNLYDRLGLTAHRVVSLNDTRDILSINDSWYVRAAVEHYISTWNFTLAPDIEIERCEERLLLNYKGVPLLVVESPDLIFDVSDTWVSPEYGSKVRSKRLIAKAPIVTGKVHTITFSRCL